MAIPATATRYRCRRRSAPTRAAGHRRDLIEDKIWPRPLGQGGAKLVVDREHAILRCRAAVEACREEGILLLARTDSRTSRGFDEALARVKAFTAEGADILFLDSPQSEDEMRTGIEAANGKPCLSVTSPAGKHFMPSDAELQRIGIRIAVYPQDILAATVHAVRAALVGLKGGAKPPMATPAELATAIRAADYVAQDSRWPDPQWSTSPPPQSGMRMAKAVSYVIRPRMPAHPPLRLRDWAPPLSLVQPERARVSW